MSEKPKNEDRCAPEAVKPQRARKQEPQPKKTDEQFDEQALDEVLRDCPL